MQPADICNYLLQLFPHGHYSYDNALDDVKLHSLRDRKRHLDVGFLLLFTLVFNFVLPLWIMLVFKFLSGIWESFMWKSAVYV
jgi:hypothetical protein